MTEINPEIGSRNWTELVKIEGGLAVKMDSKPIYQWKTESGQRPSDEWLGENGYYGVIFSDEPSFDPLIERAVQKPLSEWIIDHDSKTTTTTWTIQELTEEEKYAATRAFADYSVFWDALIGSTIYSAIREQSFVSLPMNTLATEFIALLGDAKSGRPNESAIQSSINAILVAGSFSESHLTELQAALKAGRIDGIYSIAD